MLDSAIHRLDHYPVDNTIICFCTTYTLDSELSGGQRYPTFEQLNRGLANFTFVETTLFAFCSVYLHLQFIQSPILPVAFPYQ